MLDYIHDHSGRLWGHVSHNSHYLNSLQGILDRFAGWSNEPTCQDIPNESDKVLSQYPHSQIGGKFKSSLLFQPL